MTAAQARASAVSARCPTVDPDLQEPPVHEETEGGSQGDIGDGGDPVPEIDAA
jgi:hypothetical protein